MFIMIFLCWFYKPVRFYIFSLFFEWLYENEKIAKILGIKIEEDYNVYFKRNETKLYMPGIYTILLEWFVGTKINLNIEIYKNLVRLQHEMSKYVSINKYINDLKGKKYTLYELENYLSSSFLNELNNNLKILSQEDIRYLIENNMIIREITNNLAEDSDHKIYKIYNIFKNINKINKLINILLSIPIEKRLILIITQFTVLNKIIEFIFDRNGDLTNLYFYEFVQPNAFLTIINKDTLYFIKRNKDIINSSQNLGFGVSGYKCPASKYVYEIITNIIQDLQIKIEIIGKPIYSKSIRFKKNIKNKKEIYLQFT